MLDRRITFADLTADNGLPSGAREGNAIYPDRRPKYNRKSRPDGGKAELVSARKPPANFRLSRYPR